MLKGALTSEPVLCHFDETAPTLLHTDASGRGIGAILLQRDTSSRERVVAYASRVLTDAEKNYTITEQECLAVVWSVQKFRPYLYGRHFTIVTDHHALCWLSTLKNMTGRLGRWILRLQEYDFAIIHKSGKKHQDADALSRCPLPAYPIDSSAPASQSSSSDVTSTPVSSLASIDRLSPDDQTFASRQRADPYCRRMIDHLSGASRPPNARLRRQLAQFKLDNRVLYRRIYHPDGQRWVPVLPRSLRAHVLEAFHDAMTAGHLGFHKTYDRIRSRYYWPGLSTCVAKYVGSCSPCQRRKLPTSAPAGELLPIPCPTAPFEVVGIDLYGPLPVTAAGNRWIVTAIDHLTRYAETTSVITGSASEVADFVLQAIILRHGAPRVLLSDRGKAFLSQLLNEVLRASGTTHKTASSYHPQTNGLTERFHRTLADMIAVYIQPDHKNWDKLLPFVTFAYNTAVQRTTGYSPFYLVYGRSPTSLLDVSFFDAPVNPSASPSEEFLSRLAQCRQRARVNTAARQQDRKIIYDTFHRVVSFRPGDEILLLTPLRTPGLCDKFQPRFIGPYIVLEQTSPVNYRVTPVVAATDRRCRSTEVVHVSRMKPFTRRSSSP